MKTNTVIWSAVNNNDVEILLNKADIIMINTIANINNELIKLYWSIGKMIVEYKKQNNSKYGDEVIKTFCEKLYAKYGAGFNKRNIFYSTKFYELFQNWELTLGLNEKVKNISICISFLEVLLGHILENY